jgi:hypothetical protein
VTVRLAERNKRHPAVWGPNCGKLFYGNRNRGKLIGIFQKMRQLRRPKEKPRFGGPAGRRLPRRPEDCHFCEWQPSAKLAAFAHSYGYNDAVMPRFRPSPQDVSGTLGRHRPALRRKASAPPLSPSAATPRGGPAFRHRPLKLLAFLPFAQVCPFSAPSLRHQIEVEAAQAGRAGLPVQPHHNAFPEPLGGRLVRNLDGEMGARPPREEKAALKQ